MRILWINQPNQSRRNEKGKLGKGKNKFLYKKLRIYIYACTAFVVFMDEKRESDAQLLFEIKYKLHARLDIHQHDPCLTDPNRGACIMIRCQPVSLACC